MLALLSRYSTLLLIQRLNKVLFLSVKVIDTMFYVINSKITYKIRTFFLQLSVYDKVVYTSLMKNI